MKVYTKYLKNFREKFYCGLVNVIIGFYICLNKYKDIYMLSLVLGILVFLFELFYSGNVIYCDPLDNDFISSVEGESLFPLDEVDHRAINELQDRPITYQPYHPGLQSTSQGYRFELSGSSRRLPAELHSDNISKSGGVHSSRTYGPPHAYHPSYRANPNSSPRVMVDDYYRIPNQSVRNSNIFDVGTENRVDINPIDSEFYRERYATNHFHDDIYHAAGESTYEKAKQSVKKFVD
jgi:hypothetical protein